MVLFSGVSDNCPVLCLRLLQPKHINTLSAARLSGSLLAACYSSQLILEAQRSTPLHIPQALSSPGHNMETHNTMNLPVTTHTTDMLNLQLCRSLTHTEIKHTVLVLFAKQILMPHSCDYIYLKLKGGLRAQVLKTHTL